MILAGQGSANSTATLRGMPKTLSVTPGGSTVSLTGAKMPESERPGDALCRKLGAREWAGVWLSRSCHAQGPPSYLHGLPVQEHPCVHSGLTLRTQGRTSSTFRGALHPCTILLTGLQKPPEVTVCRLLLCLAYTARQRYSGQEVMIPCLCF